MNTSSSFWSSSSASSASSASSSFQQDVFLVSLSTNACFLVQMSATRMVGWLVTCLSRRSSVGQSLLSNHQRWPTLFGRLLMEQIILFVLLVLILINLGFVSSPILPFQQHQGDHYYQITRVILSTSTARFILIALNIFLGPDVTSCASKSSVQSASSVRCNEIGSGVWHLLYCVVSIVSNVIGMVYRQNLLLVGTSSFMELNTTSLMICYLVKTVGRHKGGCRSYFKASVLSCAVSLFSRVLLPLVILSLALTKESPLVMNTIPQLWFFVSAVFYFFFHVSLLYQSFQRITNASKLMSEGSMSDSYMARPAWSNGSSFVHRYPDRLTNDISEESMMERGKDCFGMYDDLNELSRSKVNTKLKELNYGFLPCYDNRNLCSIVPDSEEEKINFLQKKNTSKNEFVHEMFTRENFLNLYTVTSSKKYARCVQSQVVCNTCETDSSTFAYSCEMYQNDIPNGNPDTYSQGKLSSENVDCFHCNGEGETDVESPSETGAASNTEADNRPLCERSKRGFQCNSSCHIPPNADPCSASSDTSIENPIYSNEKVTNLHRFQTSLAPSRTEHRPN